MSLPMASLEVVGEFGKGLESVVVKVDGEAVATLATAGVKTETDADGVAFMTLRMPMRHMQAISLNPRVVSTT